MIDMSDDGDVSDWDGHGKEEEGVQAYQTSMRFVEIFSSTKEWNGEVYCQW